MTEELTEFTQWMGTKKVYHIDLLYPDIEKQDGTGVVGGGDAPVISKPAWSFAHENPDGSAAQRIGMIELSPDGHTARFTAELPGTITVSVTALASPTAAATQNFKIKVENHQPVMGRSVSFRISQHRNGPIH